LLNVTFISPAEIQPLPLRPPDSAEPAWYALWTHSHSEQQVHDQLVSKGFHPFLPGIDVWSRRRGVRRLIRVPMFPGYLFLCDAMDKAAYLQVCAVRGLVRVLGERWDRLAVVPDHEVDAIRRASAAGRPVLPYPYLKEGRRARIRRGPLAGLEGILVEDRSNRGLLVLSVELLQRSVAVVVDCTDIEPA
jgi:transcription antitermination factor NusG